MQCIRTPTIDQNPLRHKIFIQKAAAIDLFQDKKWSKQTLDIFHNYFIIEINMLGTLNARKMRSLNHSTYMEPKFA